MIEIHSLNKSYGKQAVLKDISVKFSPAQSIGFIGPNGSGKTTLLKSILGLVLPDKGEIKVNGSDIANDSNYRRHIGYMPQISRFPENITVFNLFAMMKKMREGYTGSYDTELYVQYRIAAMGHKYLGTLSGGMKQQVSASLAFYFTPDILILDEPTAALDPVSNEILKQKIRRETQSGKLIITTSHILSDLDEIVNHVLYMMEGEITFFDDLERLKQRTSENTLNKMILKLLHKQGIDE